MRRQYPCGGHSVVPTGMRPTKGLMPVPCRPLRLVTVPLNVLLQQQATSAVAGLSSGDGSG